MSKVKIKLRHRCNALGNEGLPGDVIEVDRAFADKVIKGRGAVELTGDDAKCECKCSHPRVVEAEAKRSKSSSSKATATA